ncbi:MAG: hypothetical protein PVF17_02455, partial [Ignavibacteria bacterium]
PLFDEKFKFFGLANYLFWTDNNPQDWPGIDLGYIEDPSTGDGLDFYYPAGPVRGATFQQYSGTASITMDFNPFIIRAVGTYTRQTNFDPWSAARNAGVITSFLNTARTEQEEFYNGSGNLKFTHLMSPTTFWELNLGFTFKQKDTFDPYLKDNWQVYGDSVANADVGWVWDRRPAAGGDNRFIRPTLYNVYGLSFVAPGDVMASYAKYDRRNYSASFNFNTLIGKSHSVKFGGEFQYMDIRNFAFNNELAFQMAGLFDQNERSSNPLPIETIVRRRGVDNFGYDPLGNRTNDGLPEYEQSRNPVFAGVYLQDRFEFNDIIINAGLRYDYIDIDNWVPIDPTDPDRTWVKQTNDPIEAGIVNTPSFSSISPRLGFSFPVTDQTVFHAQWGKFVQQSNLADIYQGIHATGDNINGGFFIPFPVGFNVRPTRTTQYEIGFTQQIGEFASFDITGFYKDIKDQVVYRQIYVVDGSQFGDYTALQNGDIATTKGIELSFNMRRVERFLAYGSITFQDAKGTGSDSYSNRGIVGAPLDGVTIFNPQYITPLTFNQSLRGNFNLDYRFGKDDGGPILSQLGASLLMTFSSGHPYTRGRGGANLEGDARDRQPLEPLNNSTTPAIFQLDLRVDKTFNIADMLDLNIYLYVINLLDTRNIYNVFLRTGSPDDDGFLSDPDLGAIEAANQGPDYVALYRAVNLDYLEQWQDANGGSALTFPNMFGPPRQVRLGIRLEY